MFIDAATRQFIRSVLDDHGGDIEAAARWIAGLPGASFSRRTARQLIQAALA